ncbi:MAG: NAD-dependent epimerase/dehydratase [Ignavibacteria bacterium]|nr:NAD-dependent epimerase/dehydratase [Ignavibacteria bacterium]
MKVLITGGAGFIGSHLAERLIAEGNQVHVIDNYSTGRRDNLTPQNNLTITEGTIADTALVNQIFSEFKPNMVIHAAASYKDPGNWTEDTLTNVLGTVNIVKASMEHKVERIIYFQTALCYGLKPIEQPITFTHPLFSGGYAGGSSYAISKTGAEQYIELSGLDFISFRLANAYGPRNLSGPLPTFFQRLSTGKPCFVMETRRDFIFVDDLVDCVMKAVAGLGDRGYYHISSGSDYSIKELFDAAVKALEINLEKDVEVRPRGEDDVFTILIDPSKTNKDFEWKVSTPLEAGIKKAIEWYQKYGITQTFTHLKHTSDEKK